jgi:eukaryotic-like serine/threonine-protein kinase
MNERDIFTAALQQPAGNCRIAYLEQVCGGNAELRRRVDLLLDAHEKASGFLDSPDPLFAKTKLESRIAESPGSIIGPYKLLEQIGEGGMGTVYMAEQTQPVQRKVAVKLIKPGMDSRQVIARFEAERQALALMDHPNIAKVLDAGTTETGRPYFVMELVKGVSIISYCDAHRLTARERLQLFVPVCHAVQHAHHKGIIHRDLKPSNVMVCIYDGKPVPKVIDFGVAKATGSTLTERTLYTQFGAIVGTFEYMSPEQAEMDQLDIDTRSDVYSLGVLLYELLTGTTPLEQKRVKEVAVLELLRLIREEEPPRPSTRLSTTAALPSIAANRGTEPKRLSSLMRGELDWIAMKALEKDRNRRYETANALALDIERYLLDEPVQACPPSAGYRLRKFVRRNKSSVVVAGTVLLSLLVATVLSVFWARREQIARQETDAARREAEANFHHARQAVDDMYTQVAEKWLAHQPQMEPMQREFLKKALSFYRQFAERSSPDPAVRFETGRAYSRVGEIQHKLGEAVEAEKAYNEAILLLQGLVDEFPDNAEYQKDLAESLHRLGILIGDTGRHPEEEKVHRRALVLQRKLVATFPTDPTYRRDLARGLFYLGSTNHAVWSGRDKELREVFVEAIALQKQLVAEVPSEPEYRAELAESLMKLSSLTLIGEGQTLLRQAAALMEKLVADFPRNAEYRDALADTYFRLARTLPPTDAEKAYRQAIAVKEKLLADFPSVSDHRSDVAQGHRFLGEMLARAGKIKEAESAYRQGLAIGEPLLGIPKIDYYRTRQADNHEALGDLLATSNRFAEAEKEYQQTIALYEDWLAEDPRSPIILAAVAAGRLKLGSLLAKTNRPAAAAAAYQRANADYSKAIELKPDHSWAFDSRGYAYNALKQWDKAIADYSKAIELEPKNVWPLGNRADAYVQLQQWDKALADYSKVIELEPKNVWRLGSRAEIYSRLKQRDKALADYARIIELEPKSAEAHNNLAWFLATSAKAGLEHPNRAVELAKTAVELAPKEGRLWSTLGVAQYRAGDWKAAIAALQKSDELLQGNHPRFNAFFLAMAHWQLGNEAQARKWYDQAVGWMEKNKPQDEELLRFRAEAEQLLKVKT